MKEAGRNDGREGKAVSKKKGKKEGRQKTSVTYESGRNEKGPARKGKAPVLPKQEKARVLPKSEKAHILPKPEKAAKMPNGKRAPRAGASSPCPVSGKCGGCCYLHLSYGQQLEKKSRIVREAIGESVRLSPIIGMENPYHYRNKVNAAFDHDRKGNPISGVYQEGTHEVVPVESCLIEDEKADEIIGSIRGLLPSFKIKTYDEDTGYGLLRHVMVRRGFESGEIMVVLVTASVILPSKNHFVKALLKLHPEITTIVQNVNDRPTSMVLGERENVLYGKGYIEDTLCGLTFRISSKSFYQVNPAQTQKLYQKAVEYAGLTGKETVVDAYCGIGTIGLAAAKNAARVIGVELNADAVRDAVVNARRNGIHNARFYQGDAGEFLRNMADAGEKADVVFLDPPRSGSTREFIEAAALVGAKRIVYISCNPQTQARDLKVFAEMGYGVKKGVGVDMFPWTGHVETVCLLGKRKPDTTVKIGIDMEDYRRIRDEEKAE